MAEASPRRPGGGPVAGGSCHRGSPPYSRREKNAPAAGDDPRRHPPATSIVLAGLTPRAAGPRRWAAGWRTGTTATPSPFKALPWGQVRADVTAPVSVVQGGAKNNGNFRVGSREGGSNSRDRVGSPAVIQRRTRTGS